MLLHLHELKLIIYKKKFNYKSKLLDRRSYLIKQCKINQLLSMLLGKRFVRLGILDGSYNSSKTYKCEIRNLIGTRAPNDFHDFQVLKLCKYSLCWFLCNYNSYNKCQTLMVRSRIKSTKDLHNFKEVNATLNVQVPIGCNKKVTLKFL